MKIPFLDIDLRFRNPRKVKAADDTSGNLRNVSDYTLAYNSNEDPIIINKGVEGYCLMVRDPEVASNLATVFNLVMPGYQWKPADDSDEAIRNADFVNAALKLMPGSPLTVLRNQLFGNAFSTGLSVAQPEWMKVNLPDFGEVAVFSALNVKPTSSFINASPGIITDGNGKIIEFRQDSEYGGGSASIEDVIYYAYRGDPNNRWGRSGLHEVFDAFMRKREIYKIYTMFMATNASGIRVAKVSEEDADDDARMEKAQQVMRNLAPMQAIAVDPRWELDVQIPSSGAGSHFKLMIDAQDLQIRKGMLGDSAYSAQADQGGSYSSRQVSQSNVQQMFRAIGYAYCEDIGEQIAPMLLNANSMSGPIPLLIPEPIRQADGDPKEVVENAVKAGLIPRLSEPALLGLAKSIFIPLGINITELKPKPEPIVEPKTEPVVEPNDTEPKEPVVAAAAPEGRTRADLKRRDNEFSKLIETGQKDLSDTWATVYPQTLDKLNTAVFSKDGNGWKLKTVDGKRVPINAEDIRKIIFDDNTLRYKSSELRKSLDATKKQGWEMGNEHASETIKVKAVSVIVTPQIMTDSMARSVLRSRTMVEMNSAYQTVEKDMYYLLDNAINGGQSPQAVSAKMREVLETGGFNPSHATTIVNTTLNRTYNESRMNLYRSLQDPTGQIPGSIKGYVFAAVIDKDTTDVCNAYDNQAFLADDPNLPQPPLHFNCRSQLIPVFDDEVPWTTESGGEFQTLDKSKALSTIITTGFGGVA